MEDLGRVAAFALAVVFAWSSVAKATRPAATVTSFRGLGVPAPVIAARLVPVVEAGLAVALVAAPRAAAWCALALLTVFTAVIVRAVAAGVDVPCACFGGGTGRVVSPRDVVRNAVLAAAAIVATGAGPGFLA